MTLSNRNDLSIVELVVYAPAGLFSIFLCVRHGFGFNKGWLYLLIFSLIRLASASLQLATIGFPTSIPLLTSAALLSTIGLPPLLFVTLGFLFRACKSINKEYRTIIQRIHIRLLRIPIAIALVLITSNNSASDLTHHGVYTTQLITKIGVIVLIVIFAIIVLIATTFIFCRSHAEPGERRLIEAIAASLPFLTIRLIYVILIMFSHIPTFSIIHGSVAALRCMAVMQEIFVVIIYIGVGITLPQKRKEVPVQTGSRWPRAQSKVEGGPGRFTHFLGRPPPSIRQLGGDKGAILEDVVLDSLADMEVHEERRR